ncbi:MAG: hypothetical protein QGG42_17730 [Phycisphaerae bacterium]|jgi:hypothetical protein|nr:hypothetical protein [Phycisphaerae bacterium]
MHTKTMRRFAVVILVLCTALARTSQGAGGKGVKLDLTREASRQFRVIKTQMADTAWAKRISSQTYRRDALILPGDRSPISVILRRTKALLADIRRAKPERDFTRERKELHRLARAPRDKDRQEALFIQISRLRRRIALANPLLNFDSLLFIKRNRAWGHSTGDKNSRPGGGLFVLSGAFGDKPVVSDLLERSVVANGRLKGQKLRLGPPGGSKSGLGAVNSLDLHYDAKHIIFAYSQLQGPAGIPRNNPKGVHHLFSVNLDGSDLRQLTDGVYNDVWPRWLPDGRVVFISERRRGVSRCGGPTPNHVLHTMNANGSGVTAISFHESFEWHPAITHHGRIVYTRWDYIDRGDCIAHHPWIVAPDGRDPRAIHGNYPVRRNARPDQEQNIMPIPGSHKFVATAAPHHNAACGSLVILDPRIPDDDAMSQLKRLTPYERFPEVERGRMNYSTAWPLSEDYFLCAMRCGTGRDSFGIYLIDSFGNHELLYRDPAIGCFSPAPLRKRTTPQVVTTIEPQVAKGPVTLSTRQATTDRPKPGEGSLLCLNVYDGRKPWPKGTRITALRVIQLFPKRNNTWMNRPDISVASESLCRGVLGVVPVESDGSAHFKLPSGKLVYFQALDDRGLAVQSMQSGTHVRAGQTVACIGCHENTHKAPATRSPPLAAGRAASKLRPDAPGSYPVLFPLLVQPVLDRNCVPCHKKNAKKAPDLSGEAASIKRSGYGGGTPTWSRSYISLACGGKPVSEDMARMGFAFGLSGRSPGRTPTRTTPGQFGARASRLLKLIQGQPYISPSTKKIKKHKAVKLSQSDFHCITLWLDCNSNFFGAYVKTKEQIRGKTVMPDIE